MAEFPAASVPDINEKFDFGGVDSRSNPINMPLNRAIRCLNWVPLQGGWLRLRLGYSVITAETPTDHTQSFVPDGGSTPTFTSAIHSLDFYSSWDTSQHFALYGQAGRITKFNMGDSSQQIVAQLLSAAKWNTFRANNKIYLGNGTDMLWYDGTTWRRIGLAPFDATLFASVKVTPGVTVMSDVQIAAMSSAVVGSGGSLVPTAASGLQFYASAFDTAENDLGPAAVVGAPAIIVSTGSSVTLAGLPDWSVTNPTWINVISGTFDGLTNSFPIYRSTAVIASVARVGGAATFTLASGTVSGGDIVLIKGVTTTGDPNDESFNGMFFVESVSGSTFIVTQPELADAAGTGGTLSSLLTTDNTGGTVTVTDLNLDQSLIMSSGIGLAANAVVSDNQGYQFYISPYRINGGGHIGNRIPLGNRVLLPVASTVRISGMPSPASIDPELVGLIGRTEDGAQIPYACVDTAGDFVIVPGPSTDIIISGSNIDANSELPFNNGVPPGMDKFCQVGGRSYGNPPNSPFIYRSNSDVDQTTGAFLGVAAESWDPSKVETFPTAEAVTCLNDYDSQAWVFSFNNLAILDETAGYVNWQGPYPTGAAGPRAFVKTDHGPYWVSGKRQLCTRGNTGPLPISEEYEASLLSRIGAQYMKDVELAYYIDPELGKDYITIKAQDSTGQVFEIIHDFKLRDDNSPYGQAYVREFEDTLGNLFCIKRIQDQNFVDRLWAGDSNGLLYQLENAWNDNGVEFDADYIQLLYLGPEKLSMSSLEFQGDGFIQMSWLNRLDKGTSDMELLTSAVRRGNEPNFIYNGNIKHTEARNAFVRYQLTSHSADAPKTFLNGFGMNDPPHMPLEVYGSMFVARAESSTARGA